MWTYKDLISYAELTVYLDWYPLFKIEFLGNVSRSAALSLRRLLKGTRSYPLPSFIRQIGKGRPLGITDFPLSYNFLNPVLTQFDELTSGLRF